MVENLPAIVGNVKDMALAWVGKIPAEGNGNPLQYSCLVNSMDRGAWQAAVHGITRLKQLSMHAEGLKIQVLMYFPIFKCWQ